MKVKDIEESIKLKFSTVKGNFALAYKDLSNSKELLINPDEVFHAASTMKTPVMIEIFKQVAEGKYSFDDSIMVKNEFKSIVDGSSYSLDIGRDDGEWLYDLIGKKRTLDKLVYDMIIYSSNLATNIIIDQIDAKSVTNTIRELGVQNMHVYRGVEDMKAFDKGLNNSTTARDLMIIFEALASGKLISENANKEMIRILLDQTDKVIIPDQLPKDVRVAHKTGNITGVYHDSGIVYLPDGRKYVLVILSKNMEDTDKGVKMMAEVSRMIYDHFVEESE
ncbi:MAG: class A beta-lactamase-related serine hydrolase [Bacteroidota bacterium]|nr:class A beta-lactamase-related serine hydrolase [Bacteroidota bacterium]